MTRRDLAKECANPPVTFVVVGDCDPGLLGRLSSAFARYGYVPTRFSAKRLDETIEVRVLQDGLDQRQVAQLTERVRAAVTVHSVKILRRTSRKAKSGGV